MKIFILIMGLIMIYVIHLIDLVQEIRRLFFKVWVGFFSGYPIGKSWLGHRVCLAIGTCLRGDHGGIDGHR